MKKTPFNTWKHTHQFEEHNGKTDVIDEVYYQLPLGILGRLFGGWFVDMDLRSIFEHRAQQPDSSFQ